MTPLEPDPGGDQPETSLLDRVADAVLKQVADEFRAITKTETDWRDEVIAQFLRGEVEAAKIIPADQPDCPCGAHRSRETVEWSCERTDCPASRPPSGVTIADVFRAYRRP